MNGTQEANENKRTIRTAAAATALLKLASAHPTFAMAPEDWDPDPWLLNTYGGTVDLHTGVIRENRPEDYCTKIAVAPSDKIPVLWLDFLRQTTNGNEKLIRYLQRVAGYCLTGSIQEEALFFFYGEGGNGKGTFVGALSGAMGSYAQPAPMEVFVETRSDQHPTGLAGLAGARLVTATETERGRYWAEAKVKSLTGGDRLKARFCHKDYFEFTPQFKPIISGNNKPKLRKIDEAIRRRLHLVPWLVSIPREEQDHTLKERLRAEWGCILQWAITGCLLWQKEGLCPPPAVIHATEEYLASQEVIRRWLEERCEVSALAWESVGKLWDNWRQWCIAGNEDPQTKNEFSDELERYGFKRMRTGPRGRFFEGLRSKSDAL